MNQALDQRRGHAASGSSGADYKAAKLKKRKSSKIGDVFRKLFGRKSFKSQISLPTPTRSQGNGPNEFITSAVVGSRYPRSASMPIADISRHSALGSHAPFVIHSDEKLKSEPQPQPERVSRPQRAITLPGTIRPSEPYTDSASQANQGFNHECLQNVDVHNIGFAVTSGSNPKRRSKSADALYDETKAHRMSPIQWRQYRRRSDEIRYWRASVGPTPIPELAVGDDSSDDDDVEDEADPNPTAAAIRGMEDAAEENIAGPESPENRDTFDFGIMATSMQQQENVSVEDRLITLEVKLMDLEYAISKLQANVAAPLGQSPENIPRPTTPGQKDHPDQRSLASVGRAPPGSDSTAADSVSTQPTSTSSPFSSARSASDSHPDTKLRPISTATAVHVSEHDPPGPVPTDHPQHQLNPSADHPRLSNLTATTAATTTTTSPRPRTSANLSADHLTTLLGLIRQERAARNRLEDQVSELQRELHALRASVPAPMPVSPFKGGPVLRPRAWVDAARAEELWEHRRARRMDSFDDLSTEDGYQDVYETPVERREYEGGFISGAEGEAF